MAVVAVYAVMAVADIDATESKGTGSCLHSLDFVLRKGYTVSVAYKLQAYVLSAVAKSSEERAYSYASVTVSSRLGAVITTIVTITVIEDSIYLVRGLLIVTLKG